MAWSWTRAVRGDRSQGSQHPAAYPVAAVWLSLFQLALSAAVQVENRAAPGGHLPGRLREERRAGAGDTPHPQGQRHRSAGLREAGAGLTRRAPGRWGPQGLARSANVSPLCYSARNQLTTLTCASTDFPRPKATNLGLRGLAHPQRARLRGAPSRRGPRMAAAPLAGRGARGAAVLGSEPRPPDIH